MFLKSSSLCWSVTFGLLVSLVQTASAETSANGSAQSYAAPANAILSGSLPQLCEDFVNSQLAEIGLGSLADPQGMVWRTKPASAAKQRARLPEMEKKLRELQTQVSAAESKLKTFDSANRSKLARLLKIEENSEDIKNSDPTFKSPDSQMILQFGVLTSALRSAGDLEKETLDDSLRSRLNGRRSAIETELRELKKSAHGNAKKFIQAQNELDSSPIMKRHRELEYEYAHLRFTLSNAKVERDRIVEGVPALEESPKLEFIAVSTQDSPKYDRAIALSESVAKLTAECRPRFEAITAASERNILTGDPEMDAIIQSFKQNLQAEKENLEREYFDKRRPLENEEQSLTRSISRLKIETTDKGLSSVALDDARNERTWLLFHMTPACKIQSIDFVERAMGDRETIDASFCRDKDNPFCVKLKEFL